MALQIDSSNIDFVQLHVKIHITCQHSLIFQMNWIPVCSDVLKTGLTPERLHSISLLRFTKLKHNLHQKPSLFPVYLDTIAVTPLHHRYIPYQSLIVKRCNCAIITNRNEIKVQLRRIIPINYKISKMSCVVGFLYLCCLKCISWMIR